MMHGALVRRFRLVAALLLVFSAGAVSAFDPKEPTSVLDLQEFFLPELYLSSGHAPLDDVLGELPNRAAWDRSWRMRPIAPAGSTVWIDPRSGAATNLLGSFPLIPGSGVGNQVTLGSLGARLGRPVATVDATAVADAARQFILEHAELLGIDPAELGKVSAAQVSPDLWQVSVPCRPSGGVEVRHARLAASISHGNLVTVGTETWGRVAHRHDAGRGRGEGARTSASTTIGGRIADGRRALGAEARAGADRAAGAPGRRGVRRPGRPGLPPPAGLDVRLPAQARAGELGGDGRRRQRRASSPSRTPTTTCSAASPAASTR